MSLLLTSRAYLWTTSRVLLTRVAYQESKLLIWLHLSARLVNRDKELVATTDAHHRPVRVHAQRPGRVYKQSESLRAQDSAIQKPDQNRNYTSHSLYNHPYALNHSKMNIRQLWSQHLQSVSHDIPRISCRKNRSVEQQISCAAQRSAQPH